jgi:hypothetical protein
MLSWDIAKLLSISMKAFVAGVKIMVSSLAPYILDFD